MRIASSTVAIGAVVFALVVGVVWCAKGHSPASEDYPETPTSARSVSSSALADRSPDSSPAGAANTGGSKRIGSGHSSQAYPVELDALRARLPNNRYWALGAPTSDPAVAKLRAAAAERDNAALGRIMANEATPEEIHAYYAERRAISRDFLAVSELVLEEQGAALPERDRGLFAMSANLHKARLIQIDRDEIDALARIDAR